MTKVIKIDSNNYLVKYFNNTIGSYTKETIEEKLINLGIEEREVFYGFQDMEQNKNQVVNFGINGFFLYSEKDNAKFV